MEYLTTVRQELAPELERMNALIDSVLATRHEVINTVVANYLKTKGKQIRPVVVMLSAKMYGEISDNVIYACAALELLHNSSLIHDDVVDETKLRRGLSTINASWGNQLAVLVGDYFISNALRTGLMTGNLKIIQALSDLGKELSIGEIDQLCNVRYHHLDEDSYLKMIHKKTASLFINCAKIGAEAVGTDAALCAPLLRFAELLGLCFQIKDDIFDYFEDAKVGKPTGNDLREGKVTLPLIYALNNAPAKEANAMKALLTADTELDNNQIKLLIAFAKENGGIDYAYAKMRDMQAQAEREIALCPDSPWKEHFRRIFEYIISRNY